MRNVGATFYDRSEGLDYIGEFGDELLDLGRDPVVPVDENQDPSIGEIVPPPDGFQEAEPIVDIEFGEQNSDDEEDVLELSFEEALRQCFDKKKQIPQTPGGNPTTLPHYYGPLTDDKCDECCKSKSFNPSTLNMFNVLVVFDPKVAEKVSKRNLSDIKSASTPAYRVFQSKLENLDSIGKAGKKKYLKKIKFLKTAKTYRVFYFFSAALSEAKEVLDVSYLERHFKRSYSAMFGLYGKIRELNLKRDKVLDNTIDKEIQTQLATVRPQGPVTIPANSFLFVDTIKDNKFNHVVIVFDKEKYVRSNSFVSNLNNKNIYKTSPIDNLTIERIENEDESTKEVLVSGRELSGKINVSGPSYNLKTYDKGRYKVYYLIDFVDDQTKTHSYSATISIKDATKQKLLKDISTAESYTKNGALSAANNLIIGLVSDSTNISGDKLRKYYSTLQNFDSLNAKHNESVLSTLLGIYSIRNPQHSIEPNNEVIKKNIQKNTYFAGRTTVKKTDSPSNDLFSVEPDSMENSFDVDTSYIGSPFIDMQQDFDSDENILDIYKNMSDTQSVETTTAIESVDMFLPLAESTERLSFESSANGDVFVVKKSDRYVVIGDNEYATREKDRLSKSSNAKNIANTVKQTV